MEASTFIELLRVRAFVVRIFTRVQFYLQYVKTDKVAVIKFSFQFPADTDFHYVNLLKKMRIHRRIFRPRVEKDH